MRPVAIVQARMGSSRLPGKVLADLAGCSTLERLINRAHRAKRLSQLLVATSLSAQDDAIAQECARLSIFCFRGSEDDVLDRYYRASQECGARAIVRITADCPLIDPALVDELVEAFLAARCDYASNALIPRYPRGLGIEAFSVEALHLAWREARQPYQRVHVTPYFYQNPDKFTVLSVIGQTDYSHLRWTLDTREDLELIREIFARFGTCDDFHWRDVLALLEREPGLSDINSHVQQKALQEC